MDLFPLWNSLRIAAIASVAVFFSGILLAIGLIYFLSSEVRWKTCLVSVVLFVLCAVFGHNGSFAFWEDDSWYTALAQRAAGAGETGQVQSGEAAGEGAAYHRVVKGDTLWALAGKYGLSLSELLGLNPQIKNPNLIHVGDEVRVR